MIRSHLPKDLSTLDWYKSMVKMVVASANFGTNGRVVIPKKIRKALKIKEGDTLLFEKVSDRKVTVKIVRGEDEFVKSIHNPGEGKAIKPRRLKKELWS
ncbi:hypothetical protein AKJ48_03280 [candidate division MSBL1 archaeon SCGC-AAA261O19]|uniref:SpoVT-AbrB domain-containing protein n=1 Tax=candidate division MSBL1 archaeon SCGC-AAA261O19 TaxID=1698277 RepID=A0A133VCJ9_9EURY|nr:hypothetical protein AKJ48_03280 [candidate division MSBL1 archaeon SCGC-AAA261O19]